MHRLILDLIIFMLCFLVRLIMFIINNTKREQRCKKEKNGIDLEIKYLVNKFGLNEKKLKKYHIAALISLLDALIIVITLEIITTITKLLILQMIIGLLLVMGLIFIVYEALGRILKKMNYDKL